MRLSHCSRNTNNDLSDGTFTLNANNTFSNVNVNIGTGCLRVYEVYADDSRTIPLGKKLDAHICASSTNESSELSRQNETTR